MRTYALVGFMLTATGARNHIDATHVRKRRSQAPTTSSNMRTFSSMRSASPVLLTFRWTISPIICKP